MRWSFDSDLQAALAAIGATLDGGEEADQEEILAQLEAMDQEAADAADRDGSDVADEHVRAGTDLSGLIAENLPTGPGLAAWLSQLDPSHLPDRDLPGLAAAFRRLASWAQAAELATVAKMAVRSASRDDKAGLAEDGRPLAVTRDAAGQVSLALAISPITASWWTEFAVTLRWRLHRTWVALNDGSIDINRARIIAELTAPLTDEAARTVESEILGRAGDMTYSQLRAAVRRAVIAADPEGAEHRRKSAERQARVTLYADEDHTAFLGGSKLPAVQAAAAMARISALARAMKAAGAGGGIDLLRAQVFIGILLGNLPTIPPRPDGPPDGDPPPDDGTPPDIQPPDMDRPPDAGQPPGTSRPPDRSQSPDAARSPDAGHSPDRDQAPDAGQSPDERRPGDDAPSPDGTWPDAARPDDRTEPGDTMQPGQARPADDTDLGGRTLPPGDADVSETDVPMPTDADAPEDDGVRDTPMPSDDSDYVDCWSRGEDPLDDHVAGRGTEPAWPRVLAAVPITPGSAAPSADLAGEGVADARGMLDLTLTWSTLTGESSGPGLLGRVGPVTAVQARELARAAAVGDLAAQWRVIVTDGDGRATAVARLRPSKERSALLAEGDGGNTAMAGVARRVTVTIPAATVADTRSWDTGSGLLAAVLVTARGAVERAERLARADRDAGGCAHAGASRAYRPPPRLREYVTARDMTCRFPFCGQPAWRGDLDHTRAWHKGGRTCACNLGPLCRAHHILKQLLGWELSQPGPGVFLWTTPAGRTYLVEPDGQLV